jgi:hypothetical protein
MELCHSWEAANCAATQELTNILWNPKVHYRVHKSPPLVTILSQNDPVHTTPSYLRSILTPSTHLRLVLPNGLLPSDIPTKIFSPIRATICAHLIFLNVIILIMFDKGHKLWTSSLCSFLQPSITSCLFGPNIFLSTLFSNTLSLCSYLKVRDKVLHPQDSQAKL